MTTTFADLPATSHPAPAARSIARRAGEESLYVLASFPLGIASFTVIWTLMWMGFGMLPIFVGVFVLLGCAYVARGFAVAERVLQQTLLSRDPGVATYKSGRGLGHVWAVLSDGRSWRDIAASTVGMFTSLVSFIIVVTWWTLALSGLTYFAWGWTNLGYGSIFSLMSSVIGYVLGSVVAFVIGALALAALPAVVHAAAWIKYAPASALSGSSGADRIDTWSPSSRGSVVVPAVAAISTRADVLPVPNAIRTHGLAGAVQTLADESPVPVTVEVDAAGVPDAVAGIAYRVVDEALTNLRRHSDATMGQINVERLGESLLVSVLDDGSGGADLTRGTGLRRLRAITEASGGAFGIDSPYGGPTQIHATLPLTKARPAVPSPPSPAIPT